MSSSEEYGPNLPWLPEESFWQQNHEVLHDLFKTVAHDNPDSGADILLREPETEPSAEAMDWMWHHFMGKQHGTMEGADGKIPLARSNEYRYWPDFSRLHYGDHHLTIPSKLDTEQEYTKAFILSGTQGENIERLLTIVDYDPANENAREIIMMSGQRLRGWQAPGETSVDELLAVTAQESSADIEDLIEKSPFVKKELAKRGSDWEAPFATEYTMCRLAVEVVFQKFIDWEEYPVDITEDALSTPLVYGQADERSVPARTESMATYHLKDGRKVHVINGKAILRNGDGLPRPTSDTQTREAVELLLPEDSREKIVIASSVPHVRAALDALTRILDMRGGNVEHADIVTGRWLPWKELLAGFGEIPATHKADQRLRAVLNKQDPDSIR